MTEFVRVAKLSEIPEQTARCVVVRGKRIGLVNLSGSIHAIDDTCTHAEASLSEGEISGDEIVCPLHFATFDVRTGECTGPPADEDVATYTVRVVGDDIEVELPEEGP